MKRAPSDGPSTPSSQRTPCNSSLKRTGTVMSDTNSHTADNGASMSVSTIVTGPSDSLGGSLGPRSHMWP